MIGLVFFALLFFLFWLLEGYLVVVLLVKVVRKSSVKSFFLKSLPMHVLTVLGILCIAYGFFVEPYNLEVNKFTISTNSNSKQSVRIVQISDLHCDEKVRNEEKLAGLINPLNPDIIVFTGDAMNTPKAKDVFFETLCGLKAEHGKFAVSGNWDVHGVEGASLFTGTGFIELKNSARSLNIRGRKIHIQGLEYGKGPMALSNSIRLPKDSFNIFLFHTPDLIEEEIINKNFDLYLAGHTHGGQVALPFYGAIMTLSKYGKKYEAGMYEVGRTKLYVNRGIGMEGGNAPRVRFLARPEISVFDIE